MSNFYLSDLNKKGFLLSLNLIHWIGSFSTVGLDTHLGLDKKAEGGKETSLFIFPGEERRAEREGGRARVLAHFPRKFMHRNRGVQEH